MFDQLPGGHPPLTGDFACVRSSACAAARERHPGAAVVALPRYGAALSQHNHHIHTGTQSGHPERAPRAGTERRRMAWRKVGDCNQKAKIEGQAGRWKHGLRPPLRAPPPADDV